MLKYECKQCNMGIKGLECSHCGCALIHDHITTDDGRSVAVARCTKGCGMIKSPQCCGNDMVCEDES